MTRLNIYLIIFIKHPNFTRLWVYTIYLTNVQGLFDNYLYRIICTSKIVYLPEQVIADAITLECFIG